MAPNWDCASSITRMWTNDTAKVQGEVRDKTGGGSGEPVTYTLP